MYKFGRCSNLVHDVFISHSTKDKAIADAVCAALEADRIRCWIAPRDIRPGQKWPEAIVNAITGSRVMVLIFSANSNNSKDVAKEVMLAVNSNVIVIPFKLDDILPKGTMKYYLSDTHWLDAVNPPTAKQVQKLVETVRSVMDGDMADPGDMEEREITAVAVTRPGWFWAGVALAVFWGASALYLMWLKEWGAGTWWFDAWYLNYLTFLILSTPLLVPGVYCLRRGMTGDSVIEKGKLPYWWWALPALLGFIGGLTSWITHRNLYRRKAVNMLALGIVLTPLWVMPLFLVKNPPGLSIELIGHWQTSREANNVFVMDDIAYLANGEDGLVILDISNPCEPKEIGTYPVNNAQNVVVSGNIAYVTDQGEVLADRVLSDKLVVIDVEVPSAPLKLGEYMPESKHVHRSLNNLAVEGHMVYLPISDRLFVVDTSTASDPVTLAEFEYRSNISSPGVAVVNGVAYLQANRLHVVDVSNPARPIEIGGFETGWGSSIQVVDGIAYIPGWDDGLTILDVSTPSRPVKLGFYSDLLGDYSLLPPGASARQTMLRVTVDNDIAYITYNFGVNHGTWTDILESGIVVLDVIDPGNPRLIDQFREVELISSIFGASELLFVTDKSRGLFVLGIEGIE